MNKKTLIAITLIPFMIGLFGIITTYKKKNDFLIKSYIKIIICLIELYLFNNIKYIVKSIK